MAEVTAKEVKALRDATGAGMLDAKKALIEAEGDREKAAQILRQKGLSKVATLEDRENNQGAVAIATGDGVAALVQLKSETDFCGKSEDFVALVNKLADAVLAQGEEAGVASLSTELDDLRLAKRENIELGVVARIEASNGSIIDTYLHSQDGRGVNGVVIEATGVSEEQLHEIAMHVAFAKPVAMERSEVDAELVEKARASFEALTIKEGKPEQAVPKIVEGRLNSWFAERVLPEQGVFGEKETVAERIGSGTLNRFSQAVVDG